MASFSHEGLNLAYRQEGDPDAPAVLLLHGFASNIRVNWVSPGWFLTLTEAGYNVIAIDHRGHGASDKPHDAAAYTPAQMAADALALTEHLNIRKAALFGYSMGARVAAFAALKAPERFPVLVFGGLGIGLVKGVGSWTPVAEALRAPSLDDVTDPKGRMFRSFADRTGSDKEALAACISATRQELTAEEVGRIRQPVLVGVGTKDDIAGSAEELAGLMPNAEAYEIAGRDHMLSVGDRHFKAEVLRFLADQRLFL
ncbi:alpha/beta fold hydrolase [Consotaella salsifontis]|uniref:Pimeloyl-ACP methyl ester carboxylesterase n=1 Tax=Consotaella salsifontis TaxID=1365950 RepID=A0A1T4L7I8_9HYPH|nr:alpha/beta hydrolase [Consotaella salsifontis]SJZ50471.1 Pimeloyl-ACP methyl ester carboxylesterase [Consotaella salsifontis]